MSTIKAGYRLSVTSWENDGDNNRTITKDGLQESEVKYIIKLLSLIKNSDDSFGNMYDPDDSELDELSQGILDLGDDVVTKLTEEFSSKDPAELPYQYAEEIGEYTGYCEENRFTRVVESIIVEYVPQEITIEDVSAQFGV